MKVIFLDVDGVLNCVTTQELIPDTAIIGIDTNLLLNLKTLIEKTNAKIVLSSSWRMFRNRENRTSSRLIDYLEDKLNSINTEIYDQIDIDISEEHRGQLIKRWLKYNEVSKFAIIDDDVFDYELEGLMPHVVITNLNYGLTENKVKRVLKLFGVKEKL